MVYVAMPEWVRPIPLGSPELAKGELVELIGRARGMSAGAAIDLEPLAEEAVDGAYRNGAFLLAMVTPPGAHPAVLTGVAIDFPIEWTHSELEAELLREVVEDSGGPDVRETMVLDTPVGKAVVVQRVPGREQLRAREQHTVQLQGMVVDPETGDMLLLTLACPSVHGWDKHQQLFLTLMASVSTDPNPVEQLKASRQPHPAPADDDGIFQPETFRV